MSEKIKKIFHRLKTLPEGYLLSSPFSDDANDKSGHLVEVEKVERYVEALEQENEKLKKENQSHVQLIRGAIESAKDYEKQIKVLEKALEIICDSWGIGSEPSNYIKLAEEELNNETKI